MVRTRSGRSSLGCLVVLLLVVAVGYFGVNVAEVYWRYFQFRDAVRQQVRFAHRTDDGEIKRRLRAKADSLGLPESAGQVQVRRTRAAVVVATDYVEQVELPGVVREFHFRIDEEGAL